MSEDFDPSTYFTQDPSQLGPDEGPLSGVSPPIPDFEYGKAPGPAPAPEDTTEPSGRQQLKGIYKHDPNTIEDLSKTQLLTPFAYFGGEEDYRQEQKQPGTGDRGQYAKGGGSYDPRTGKSSKIPVVALPRHWFDSGVIESGDLFEVYNPSDPSRRVKVAAMDIGPNIPHRGADLYLPEEFKKHLGLDTDQQLGMDLTPIVNGNHDRLTQAPVPGSAYDDSMGEKLRAEIGATSDRYKLAGDNSLDAINHALEGEPKSRNKDGSINYSDNVRYYPDMEMFEYRTPLATYQLRKGEKKPHIINTNPKSNIYHDPDSGMTYDISQGIANAKPIGLPGSPEGADIKGIKPGDWNSVPEEFRETAQRIAQYRYAGLTGRAGAMLMKTPYMRSMMAIVNKVDPSFDPMLYQQRQDQLNDLTSKGKMGQNLISFNTALDHLNQAMDSSNKLVPIINSQDATENAQHFAYSVSQQGDPRPNAYITSTNALMDEMGRAVSGGVPHESEVKRWQGSLGIAPTKDSVGMYANYLHKPERFGFPQNTIVSNESQRKAGMDTMAALLGSRMGELETGYERVMHAKPNFAFISPEAADTLVRLGTPHALDLVKKYGPTKDRPYVDPRERPTLGEPLPGALPTNSPKGTIRTDNTTGKQAVSDGEGGWTTLP